MGFLSNLLGKAADTTYLAAMSVTEAIADYRANNPEIANTLDNMGAEVAISVLPAKYDNVPYNTVVNGKWVHTVGEYKVALPNEWDYLG